VKAAFNNRTKFQLPDSANYFFENLPRISSANYIPSLDDILLVRIRTNSVEEVKFDLGQYPFTVVDVGGQRSERSKWMSVFCGGITAMIFFAAINEYDQKLAEDNRTNRMSESVKLFYDICHYKMFAETAVILFLNKTDLFRKKIETSPLVNAFPEYNGRNNFEEASDYVKRLYTSQCPKKKVVYPHFVTATDTENVKLVFKSIKDALLRATLNTTGIEGL